MLVRVRDACRLSWRSWSIACLAWPGAVCSYHARRAVREAPAQVALAALSACAALVKQSWSLTGGVFAAVLLNYAKRWTQGARHGKGIAGTLLRRPFRC